MKKLMIAALAVFTLSSCFNNNESDIKWSQDLVGVLTTTNVASGEVVYTDEAASVTMELPNAFKSILNFTFNNVRFMAPMPAMNISISNLPFTVYTDTDMALYPIGSWVVDEKSVVPTIGGVPYENFTMQTVKCVVSDYVVMIEYTLNLSDVLYRVRFEVDKTPESDDDDDNEEVVE